MIKKNYLLFALTLLSVVSTSLFGQSQLDTTLLKHRQYEGEGLYGFMNGGSDLYYEYGFEFLKVENIKFEGFEYQLEEYRMSSPLNAFGIYSIHVFKPLKVDYLLHKGSSLVGFDCLSKYQLQAAFGNIYFSIVFNDGEIAAAGAEKLLLALVSKYSQPSLEESAFPSFIPSEITKFGTPFSGKLQFAAGPLGLSSANEDAPSLFDETGTSGVWLYQEEIVKILREQ